MRSIKQTLFRALPPFFCILIVAFFLPVSLLIGDESEDYYNQGVDYLNREEYSKSIDFFRKSIRKNPNVPQVYNAQRFSVSLEKFPHIQKINDHCLLLDCFKDAHPDKQPDAKKSI